ncbi:MAG: deoxyribodipyrimidine photo-lyase, partial [Planctomycetota bacterium]
MSNTLVWFRQDLRLHDNPALDQALHKASDLGGAVVCLYVLDPIWFGKTRFGFDRIGPFRRKFLRESLCDLSHRLHSIGGRLSVVRGDSVPKLLEVIEEKQVAHVYCQKEYGTEERRLEKHLIRQLEKTLARLTLTEPNTLFAPDQLPFVNGEFPDVFSKFRRKVE